MTPEPELVNPFPGLRPFEPDESYLFFGRDGQGDELLRRLRQSRFVGIVGTSGSGKSSLVRAGLIPALHGGVMTRAGSSWRIALFRPGNNPIGRLAEALSASGIPPTVSPAADERTAMLDAVLRRSGVGLVEAIRQEARPAHENLLIIVDQFEELFRFVRQGTGADEDGAAFVKLMLEARRQTEVPIYVALTMRSDFLGDCARFRDLPEALNESQYLVPRMTRDQRREAIEGPVQVAGAEIAPRLLQRLLNDVGDNPDQLPILQHALMRTWEYWRRTAPARSPLDLEHYVAIGTMAEALSRHADEAFDDLGPRGASIAEKLFKRLTERGPDNREIRRPATLAEVGQVTSATLAEATAVVDCFRRSDRSFLMPPGDVALGADTLIDISHESLIRLWGRLRTWVAEEAASRDQYLRLIADADRHARHEVALWQDPELQLALDWSAAAAPNAIWAERYDPRFDVAMAFLHASRRQRDEEAARQSRARAAKRRAAYAVAVASVLLAAVFAGLLVYARRQQAVAQRALSVAEEQRRAAISRQLASQSRNEVSEGQLSRALLLGVEAARAFPTSDARASLLNAFEHSRKLVTALQDPGGAPTRVVFSPDGRTFASANPAGVTLWDTKGGRLLAQLPRKGVAGDATDIAFGPDGGMLAASFGNEVALWDLEHDRAFRQLRAALPVSAIAFSPDSQTIAVGQRGDLITLWNARTGAKAADLRVTARNYLISLAFHSSGTRLAAGYEDGAFALWDLPTRTRVSLVEHRELGPIKSLLFHPGGGLLLGTRSGIFIVDPETGKSVTSFGGDDPVDTLALSADGNLLAVGSARTDRPLTLWDLSTSDRRATTLEGHLSKVTSVAFSADGRHLASVGADSELMLWDVRRSEQPLAMALASADVNAHEVAISPDGTAAAVAARHRTSNAGEVVIWNLRDEKPAAHIAVSAGIRDSLAFSADGTRVVVLTCSDEQQAPPNICNQLKVTFWDARSGRPAADPVALPVSTHDYALDPHGTLVVAANCREPAECRETTVDVWDLGRRPLGPRVLLTGSEKPERFVFSRDGGRLAMCAGKRSTIWELSTGAVLGPPFECTRAAFSDDGMLLATTLYESIQIRDASNGRPLSRSLAAGNETVHTLTFAPSGKELVSDTLRRSGDTVSQALMFWDLRNPASPEQGYLLRTGTTSDIERVAYSPDGGMLVSTSWNDGAFAWDVSERSWMDRACGIAGRNLTQEEWQRAFGDQPYRLTCASLPAHPTVVDAAMALAREGDVDAAAVILRRVAEVDPSHAPDTAALLKDAGVPGLLKKAEYFFASGDSRAAAAALVRAGQLDPALDASRVLRELGERLAGAGNVDGAILAFRYARSRNPALGLNPESEARRLAAPEVLKQGIQLARDHRVAEAVAAFDRARGYDRTLDIYPEAWHDLCRAGLMTNQASRVRDACNNTMGTAEDGKDTYLESRGIMRALTGDTAGALADLRKSVALRLESESRLKEQRGGSSMVARSQELRQRGQTWIDALSRGEQPFTPDVLSALDR
jgi:WD40 repeat protein/tetratricopeptide (TPR) repeat protein